MKYSLIIATLLFNFSMAQVCTNGLAGVYPCSGLDLKARVDFPQMGGIAGTEGNDCWGWTDSLTGKEYAIMCCTTHTAFIDISNPTLPVYLGKVNSRNNVASIWRDAKVYNNYAFIVSEALGHGMQIFDLTRLRNVTTPQVFTPDALYSGFGKCHNIAINPALGFAYCVGSDTYGGGPHVVNIQNPLIPVFSFGLKSQGYTHDAQTVIYNGPDTQHTGKEIYFGANETKVVVIDVTNKSNPILLSTFFYDNNKYSHQGWLTEDSKYWILGDELDETNFGFNTRSVIIDMTDLDNPVFKGDYYGTTPAIDHNGYTKNGEFYLANYQAGLRIMNASNITATSNMTEVAFFDTYPSATTANFNGAWSTYPYFNSGNILISDIERGLFIVKKNTALSLQNFEKNSFRLSPNPTENFVNIESVNKIESIVIFDILGKKVLELSNLDSNLQTLDVTKLNSGVYVVKVNQSNTLKLIKE